MAKYLRLFYLLLVCAPVWAGADRLSDELFVKAKQTYEQRGPTAALPLFEKALTTYRAAKDPHGEAVILGYLANCNRRLGNLNRALELAQRALAMKENLGDRLEAGKTHNQLGLIYWDMADYPSAKTHLERAIDIGASLGDMDLEGAALNNLGLVLDERGEYKQSLQEYQRALELHRKSHFERGESDTLANIGGVYLLLGRFREALDYYRQGLAISQRLDLKPTETDDLGNIALCLKGMGEIDGSLKTFDHALQIAHDAGLSKEEADWHRGKGNTLAGLGRYDAALEEYGNARRVYERSGLKSELDELSIDAGRVDELLGDMGSAAGLFRRALAIARSIGNRVDVTDSYLALGDLEHRRKRYDVSESYLVRALRSARASGNDASIVDVEIERAVNDIDRQELVQALGDAEDANRIAAQNENGPATAVARYVLGEAYRSRGQLPEALAQYLSAENLDKELQDPEIGWRLLFGRGQALAAQGNDEEALAAYKSSIELIEETRSTIAEERFRAGYIEERFQVYVAMVELLLKLGRPGEALSVSEKLRARAYFEQLGQNARSPDSVGEQRAGELREQIRTLRQEIQKEYAVSGKQKRSSAVELFKEELEQAQRSYQVLLGGSRNLPVAAATLQTAPTTSEIQDLLSPDTALIEYVVGAQTLSILTVTRYSVTGTTVRATSDSLSSRVELLRDLILGRQPEWREPAAGLEKLLLAPLLSAGNLQMAKRLVIVPDGVLNYVPFAALPLSGTKVLGDDFVVSYLPAIAALRRSVNPRPSGRSLLAMAPSEVQLPNASLEVVSIGKLFPKDSLIVAGNAATKTLFERVAGDYEYIHLATHGSLNRNAPLLSNLQLQPDDRNDGRLELYEILELKLHARLVTLSACETALGSGYFSDTPAGDEFVGMTRAFLSAGSDSVLASLWEVNDRSTRLLMVSFYRNLQHFDGPQALALAERELRRSDERYSNPYYWAPFVMVSNAK